MKKHNFKSYDTLFAVQMNEIEEQIGLNETNISSLNRKAQDLENNAFSGNYNDLSGKPSLFSGKYSDLTGKPTIPAAYNDSAVRQLIADLTIRVKTLEDSGGSGLIYQPGDSFVADFYAIGYATSATSFRYSVPLDRPVSDSVNSTVDAICPEGFVIRQKGAYVGGTSSTVRKTASNIFGAVKDGFVNLIITMPSGSGLTTNEFIGVNAAVTITFNAKE